MEEGSETGEAPEAPAGDQVDERVDRHLKYWVQRDPKTKKLARREMIETDASHPPFVFFVEKLESDKEEDRILVTETLTLDLEKILDQIRGPGEETKRLYFVWIFRTQDKEGVRFQLDPDKRENTLFPRLVLLIGEHFQDYAQSEELRARTSESFEELCALGQEEKPAPPPQKPVSKTAQLRAFIQKHPDDPATREKRIALGDLRFLEGWEAVRRSPESNDGIAHLEIALAQFEAIAAAEDGPTSVAGRAWLKSGIIAYLLAKVSPEKDRWMDKALQAIQRALKDTPFNDPGTLWAWTYAALLASEQDRKTEIRTIHDLVFDPNKGILDLVASLATAPEAAWMIEEPLEALFPLLEEPQKKKGLPPLGIFKAPPFIEQPEIRFRLKPDGETKRSTVEETALSWLALHQDPSGCWDCDGFSNLCKGEACSGPGFPLHDPGVTGLALLALLGADNTVINGPYQEEVRKGLRYLLSIQDRESGSLCPDEKNNFRNYDHAVACLALLEGYRRCRWPALIEPVDKALYWIHRLRYPGAGWRYGVGSEGARAQSDVSVTGWMIQCLLSARAAGFPIDEEDMHEGLAFIAEMTDPETGRTGYLVRGGRSSRELGDARLWPPERTEAMTAAALACRLAAGKVLKTGQKDEEILQKGLRLIKACPPQWNPGPGGADFYYWYQGAQVMGLLEGKEDARKWRSTLFKGLKENQALEGCAKGSWDPRSDPFGDQGGRIYTTAMGVLALEAFQEK